MPTRNNAPVNSDVASAAHEKSDHRDRQQRHHHNRCGIGHRPDAADQGSLAACRLHPSMQLGDEGAVAVVLRRHQGRGLPTRRQDRDASATAAVLTSARKRCCCIETGRDDSRIALDLVVTATGPNGRRCSRTAPPPSARSDARRAQRRLVGIAFRTRAPPSSSPNAALRSQFQSIRGVQSAIRLA